MDILKVCDVCGSPTIEGQLGESWWLCTNPCCRKNNPNWSFNETFDPYREKYNSINSKINKLSTINISDFAISIKLHDLRWIGDGSGEITVKNDISSNSIMFYLDKDKVFYQTDDSIYLNLFNEAHLDIRLKEMWQLKREKFSIFSTSK